MIIKGYVCHYGDYYKNYPFHDYEINEGAFTHGLAACEKVPVFFDSDCFHDPAKILGYATLSHREDGIFCEIKTNDIFNNFIYQFFNVDDLLKNTMLGFWATAIKKDKDGNIDDGIISAVYFTKTGYEPIISVEGFIS
jgi:hypothetical protein